VYVDNAEANSFTRQKLAGQIHAFTAGENSSMQAMDSRRCLNSASSQRQAGENHAAKVENCNARLAMARYTVQAMYCRCYLRQSKAKSRQAGVSQPRPTILLDSRDACCYTRKLKTTRRELCVDSLYFHLAFADVQFDATVASYRTR
jgi:hypothetical protein